jgi:hypothetical protein
MTAQDTVTEQVLGLLSPFFLDGAGGDPDAARSAAAHMLAGYSTETTEELQIAAQIIACGFAVLDSLSRSMADKTLTVNTQLRLRGSANAMNRAVQQGRVALNVRRKTHSTTPATTGPSPIAAEFRATMQKASDAISFARSDLTEKSKPQTYWQARRADERQARQAERRAATA